MTLPVMAPHRLDSGDESYPEREPQCLRPVDGQRHTERWVDHAQRPDVDVAFV